MNKERLNFKTITSSVQSEIAHIMKSDESSHRKVELIYSVLMGASDVKQLNLYQAHSLLVYVSEYWTHMVNDKFYSGCIKSAMDKFITYDNLIDFWCRMTKEFTTILVNISSYIMSIPIRPYEYGMIVANDKMNLVEKLSFTYYNVEEDGTITRPSLLKDMHIDALRERLTNELRVGMDAVNGYLIIDPDIIINIVELIKLCNDWQSKFGLNAVYEADWTDTIKEGDETNAKS